VAVLPTASYPDGEEVFTRWAAMGVAHFGALGAEVEPVLEVGRARLLGADVAHLSLNARRFVQLPPELGADHARLSESRA
jgi:hypothetical protein